MKIIHTADVHLDSAMTSRLTPDKIRKRKRELLSSFKRTAQIAEREGAEAIIISGDLFDTDRVTLSTLESVVAIISSYPRITFFYLFGNHEGDTLLASGITLPKNLKTFSEGWTYYELGDLTVAGRCENTEDMFTTLKLDPERKNIVLLHGELADKSTAGRIGIRELAELPIDYLALGHYHSYSEARVSERTVAVYPGTPEGRGFDECGEKGVVLVEANGTLSHRFIRCAMRTLHTVSVDISGKANAYEVEKATENATRGIPCEDIVRVLLVGERAITEELDTDALVAWGTPRFFCFECRDDSRIRISADEFKNDKTLKGEFIRGVIADTTLTEEQKHRIITTGLRALLGEQID